MRALLINVSLMGAVAAGAAWAANSALSVPDMHVSHTTGECVKVINYTDTQYTCERQPTKYNHIWVK
jgi:hypothetical protein